MTNQTKIEYHEDRLIELILYIGAKCGLDEHYGVLKLNKILFYSDFLAFQKRGKPITGADYKKYPNGPAPSVMKRLRKQMEQSGDAFEYKNELVGYYDEPISEKRLLPMRKANLEILDREEIAIVDSVIERLRPLSGMRVSKMSHEHPGWRIAEMETTIPYAAALLPEGGSSPLSIQDFERARRVADKYAAA